MTPLEEFRLWLRQGPTAERVVAAVAAAVALALVVWVAIPPGGPSTGAVAAGGTVTAGQGTGSGPATGSSGPAPGAAATGGTGSTSGGVLTGSSATGAGASGPASGTGSATGAVPGGGAVPAQTSGGGGAAAGGANCGPSGSTDQGVTATEVHIGVMILNIGGANSAIGVPTPQQMTAENQAYINWINGHGGIKCRKVVPTYYTDDPLDSNGEHSLCVQIVSDKVFSVIGDLYSTQNITCLPAHQIPVYGQTGLPHSFHEQFFPYFYTFYNDSTPALKNMVLGGKQEGWFNDNGSRKVGLIEQDCYPEYTTQTLGPLASIGIPQSQTSAFDYGCNPTDAEAGPPANEVTAMILQFERDGVTHVVDAGYSGTGISQISVQANRQGYHPKYLVSDVDQTIGLTGGSTSTPDPSFNGLAITGSQYGAREAGLPDNAGTGLCDSIMKANNAPVSHDGDGYAGGVCDQFGVWYEGAQNAPALVRTDLSAGLNNVGNYQLSYPGGPTDWTIKGITWASNFWRPSVYIGSCKCWKVTDATYRPNF